ncbi:MAG: 30S ribosomal protein S3 [Alphaproteobacteria bacterium]|nr:MAG: 30S ribosomal protein S3 [Alphaproteobacteria bacterium]
MGQKINPIGFRIGVIRSPDSRWHPQRSSVFGPASYGELLHKDLRLRQMLEKRLGSQAGISRIVIERPAKKTRVTVYSARPGVVIGKKGADIEKLRTDLAKMAEVDDISLNLVEIRKPELDARLIAEGIANQLERRIAFRRAMKRAVQSAMRLGALGIRVNCGGRLGGAEIARTEWYREGRVPLQTLRADIDYGTATAKTTYGACGVKVWVFKGEILEHDPMAVEKRAQEQGNRS